MSYLSLTLSVAGAVVSLGTTLYTKRKEKVGVTKTTVNSSRKAYKAPQEPVVEDVELSTSEVKEAPVEAPAEPEAVVVEKEEVEEPQKEWDLEVKPFTKTLDERSVITLLRGEEWKLTLRERPSKAKLTEIGRACKAPAEVVREWKRLCWGPHRTQTVVLTAERILSTSCFPGKCPILDEVPLDEVSTEEPNVEETPSPFVESPHATTPSVRACPENQKPLPVESKGVNHALERGAQQRPTPPAGTPRQKSAKSGGAPSNKSSRRKAKSGVQSKVPRGQSKKARGIKDFSEIKTFVSSDFEVVSARFLGEKHA